MNLHRVFGWRLTGLLIVLTIGSTRQAAAVGINDYQYQRSFALPAGLNVLYDPLPDGRVLALSGATVSVETAPKSGLFATLGNIPGFTPPSFGPSFLAVSPDGTRAAAGSNSNSVVVFATSNPSSATTYAQADFSGEWVDNRYLAITNGFSGAEVDILDTTTSAATTVITNIGGAPGGIAFDATGNLYTSNGFTFGTGSSDTGWIKEFSLASWQNALNTSAPLNFETTGTPVAELLSALPIGFDTSGNMFVGGADFFGSSNEFGFAALVDAGAVGAALASPQATPPITGASPTSVLRKFLSPQSTIDSFSPPNWNFNAATGELYLNYAFGDGIVNVYAIPEPSALFLTALAVMLVLGHCRYSVSNSDRQLYEGKQEFSASAPGSAGVFEAGQNIIPFQPPAEPGATCKSDSRTLSIV